jgi:hypothetical protein
VLAGDKVEDRCTGREDRFPSHRRSWNRSAISCIPMLVQFFICQPAADRRCSPLSRISKGPDSRHSPRSDDAGDGETLHRKLIILDENTGCYLCFVSLTGEGNSR